MADERNQHLGGIAINLPDVLQQLYEKIVSTLIPEMANDGEYIDDRTISVTMNSTCQNGCCAFNTTIEIRRGVKCDEPVRLLN